MASILLGNQQRCFAIFLLVADVALVQQCSNAETEEVRNQMNIMVSL